MLTNQYPVSFLKDYQKIFLDNFIDETPNSFNYLVKNYLKPNNIYLSIDSNQILELGLMVIPKNIYINKEIKKAGLIYGVVASDKYKHTGILKKIFPAFINELYKEYDLILIESEHWKIYKNFDLIPINFISKFISTNKIDKKILKKYLIDFRQETIIKIFDIYKNHIKNFHQNEYVFYSFNEFEKVINLNILMDDKIFIFNNAFGLYSSKFNLLQSIYFESEKDLIDLVNVLPKDTKLIVDKKFSNLLPKTLIKEEDYAKTKMFNQPNLLKSLFFVESN
ncbi:hypothetical protein [Mycoplasmoides pirum]|uniref:hypothetical protein n=1 Tax=Mycoplasmoides pirum TaxID=2122 RepID=UPI0004838EB6|nr:hypothetical protein [Mycoplasmoides pirum]